MGLFSTKKPLHVEAINQIDPLHKQSKEFMKGLLQFQKSLASFEKTSARLVQVSSKLVSSNKVEKQMEKCVSNFNSGMAKSVHQPVAAWLNDFKQASINYKAVQKLAAKFDSTNKAMIKAADKQSKATRDGANPEALKKLSSAAMAAAKTHDAAKTALASQAPKVSAEYNSLVIKMGSVRESVFASFSVASDSLRGLASLTPQASQEVKVGKKRSDTNMAVVPA